MNFFKRHKIKILIIIILLFIFSYYSSILFYFPVVGTISGVENEKIIVHDKLYSYDESLYEEDISFSNKDRGVYIGSVANENIKMRLFRVKGDNEEKYIYAFWDFEGRVYVRLK